MDLTLTTEYTKHLRLAHASFKKKTIFSPKRLRESERELKSSLCVNVCGGDGSGGGGTACMHIYVQELAC